MIRFGCSTQEALDDKDENIDFSRDTMPSRADEAYEESIFL